MVSVICLSLHSVSNHSHSSSPLNIRVCWWVRAIFARIDLDHGKWPVFLRKFFKKFGPLGLPLKLIEYYLILLYSLHRKKVYTCGKGKYSKSRGARGKVWGVPHPHRVGPSSWSKLDQASLWNYKRCRHKNKKSEATSHEKYRKIQSIPFWTNSMVGFSAPLLFIWHPSVLSTRLNKSSSTVKTISYGICEHEYRLLILTKTISNGIYSTTKKVYFLLGESAQGRARPIFE